MTQAAPPEASSGRVIVLGSINVDLLVSAPRLPHAGETVPGSSWAREVGGKGANQAVGAAQAGAQCLLLACVGDDPEGAAMVERLAGHGVDVTQVRRTAGSTGCALVATSPADNQIIYVAGANACVGEDMVETAALTPDDICLAQMETPVAATRALFVQARAAGGRTVLNAAPALPQARSLLPLCDVLIVNEAELWLLAGESPPPLLDDAILVSCMPKLGLKNDQVLVVTLGSAGVAMIIGDTVSRIGGHSVPVVDTTGAGDCFSGYLSAGLARGSDLRSSLIEANCAASLAVQTTGAACSVPARAIVLETLGG